MLLHRQIQPWVSGQMLSQGYYATTNWVAKTVTGASDRYVVQGPEFCALDVGGQTHKWETAPSLDLSSSASWDTTSPTDYTSAATRAGKDFYIYACQSETAAPTILLSANATYPSGYTADDSRKIGGFHCLCVSVGTIADHPLSDYVAGDILPDTVWDLWWRADSGSNVGLTYSSKLNEWASIYLMSGTAGAPTILNGGTILDTITWFNAASAAALLNMRLPKDYEFQVFAAGTPEAVNITGSADPVTTTGHISTGSVRMISSIGCEDCAGVIWQWLDEQSYRFDAATAHTHSVTLDGGVQASVTSGNASADVAPVFGYKAQTGGKGSLYTQGAHGMVKLRAGGNWSDGAACGSRSRSAPNPPWDAPATIGFRAVCGHIRRCM